MEMHQIRYALAVAHHLSFTRAAEFCDASQPALSKGVRSLEAELGQPLFHRDGKRISVSEFGRSMLPQLQRIAEEADLARTLAENFRLLNQVPVGGLVEEAPGLQGNACLQRETAAEFRPCSRISIAGR